MLAFSKLLHILQSETIDFLLLRVAFPTEEQAGAFCYFPNPEDIIEVGDPESRGKFPYVLFDVDPSVQALQVRHFQCNYNYRCIRYLANNNNNHIITEEIKIRGDEHSDLAGPPDSFSKTLVYQRAVQEGFMYGKAFPVGQLLKAWNIGPQYSRKWLDVFPDWTFALPIHRQEEEPPRPEPPVQAQQEMHAQREEEPPQPVQAQQEIPAPPPQPEPPVQAQQEMPAPPPPQPHQELHAPPPELHAQPQQEHQAEPAPIVSVHPPLLFYRSVTSFPLEHLGRAMQRAYVYATEGRVLQVVDAETFEPVDKTAINWSTKRPLQTYKWAFYTEATAAWEVVQIFGVDAKARAFQFMRPEEGGPLNHLYMEKGRDEQFYILIPHSHFVNPAVINAALPHPPVPDIQPLVHDIQPPVHDIQPTAPSAFDNFLNADFHAEAGNFADVRPVFGLGEVDDEFGIPSTFTREELEEEDERRRKEDASFDINFPTSPAPE